jgi:hypothetical protein
VLVELKQKNEALALSKLDKKDLPQMPVAPQVVAQVPNYPPHTELFKKQESVKKKKKNFQPLTKDLIDAKVTAKYPNFPSEYLSDLYTEDGDDLYVNFKKKKLKIEKYILIFNLVGGLF